MHKDFHLYGTYLAARIAGFNHEDAGVISAAAQAVDDFTYETEYKSVQKNGFFDMLKDGIMYRKDDPEYYRKGKDCPDRYFVRTLWTCFHFLPGDIDEVFNPDDTNRKYITRPGGRLYNYVKTMLLSYNGKIPTDANQRNDVLARIGVALHVIADTYAHEGFCGIDTELNIAENIKITNFNKKVDLGVRHSSTRHVPVLAAELIDFASIGHGTAGHIPDISWIDYIIEYKYRNEGEKEKKNPEIFANAFVEIVKILHYILNGNFGNIAEHMSLYMRSMLLMKAKCEKNIKEYKSYADALKEENDTVFKDFLNDRIKTEDGHEISEDVKVIYDKYLDKIADDIEAKKNQGSSQFEIMEYNSFTNALLWHRSNVMEIIFEHVSQFPEYLE